MNTVVILILAHYHTSDLYRTNVLFGLEDACSRNFDHFYFIKLLGEILCGQFAPFEEPRVWCLVQEHFDYCRLTYLLHHSRPQASLMKRLCWTGGGGACMCV